MYLKVMLMLSSGGLAAGVRANEVVGAGSAAGAALLRLMMARASPMVSTPISASVALSRRLSEAFVIRWSTKVAAYVAAFLSVMPASLNNVSHSAAVRCCGSAMLDKNPTPQFLFKAERPTPAKETGLYYTRRHTQDNIRQHNNIHVYNISLLPIRCMRVFRNMLVIALKSLKSIFMGSVHGYMKQF